MNSGSKRILWLINHTTLRAFEVPLLRALGFEVYVSKLFPDLPGNRSASTDYSWDDQLTLPRDVVEKLNSFDFYSDPISPTIRRLLNDHFETAIVAYMFPMLDNVIQHFRGRILLRAFGLTSKEWNYFSYAKHLCDPGFTRRLARVLHRFWFAQAYPNLESIEPDLMRRRAVTLPVGLPESITRKRGIWRQARKQILFVCPDINVFAESRETYLQFKAHLGDYPHRICGAQNVAVKDDPAVTGYLSREAYDEELAGSAVMFYHSELPRHLHYHPLEALCFGVPLVFMKQGMLSELGGRSLPGACATFEEARAKIKRILDGDDAFARGLIDSQSSLLNQFLWDSCFEQWSRSFVNGVMRTPALRPKEFAKIAVMCISETTDCARRALSLADGLRWHGTKFGATTRIVTGISAALRTATQHMRAVCPELSVREFSWTVLDQDSVRRAQEFQGFRSPLTAGSYLVADDGMSHFMDCDFWILVGDSVSLPIAPVKAYALYVADLSRLLVPKARGALEAEAAFVNVARGAVAILSHSRAALEDMRRHCAIAQDFLVPVGARSATALVNVDPRCGDTGEGERPTLLWIMASDSPFIHPNTFEVLEQLVTGEHRSYDKIVVIDAEPRTLAASSGDVVRESILEGVAKLRPGDCGGAALKPRFTLERSIDFDRWMKLLSSKAVVWWPSWSAGGVELCRAAANSGATIVAHRNSYVAELGNGAAVTQINTGNLAEHAAALISAARDLRSSATCDHFGVDYEELWSQLRALA